MCLPFCLDKVTIRAAMMSAQPDGWREGRGTCICKYIMNKLTASKQLRNSMYKADPQPYAPTT